MTSPHLTQEAGHALSRALMRCAKLIGLDWVVSYEDSAIDGFPSQREPHAFRLVAEDGAAVSPPQVIGETFIDSWDCISVAARPYLHAVPCDDQGAPLPGSWAAGGNFIHASDSRFPSQYPISVHDRDMRKERR